MAKQPLAHFSPVFANKTWAIDGEYVAYTRNRFRSEIQAGTSGFRQWGRRRGLWNWAVEKALNELETEAARAYRKLCSFADLDLEERICWSQYILSQLVRTPTFMRYERKVRLLQDIRENPGHDRVGCKRCSDLAALIHRDWCLLLAHRKDYFVRSDNPVLVTGFVERPETALFYPLTPRLCFAACSMPAGWTPAEPQGRAVRPIFGRELAKGDAYLLNFYFARSAADSLIVSPDHDGSIANAMFGDILGSYPQPPFSLHSIEPDDDEESAFESIRMIMSVVDSTIYSPWLPIDVEPFHKPEAHR